jgi:hypothetical protein
MKYELTMHPIVGPDRETEEVTKYEVNLPPDAGKAFIKNSAAGNANREPDWLVTRSKDGGAEQSWGNPSYKSEKDALAALQQEVV